MSTPTRAVASLARLSAPLSALPSKSRHALIAACQVAIGVLSLTLASRLSVPSWLSPVPVTLQPQVAMLLAATLGRRRALAAVGAWLSLAACGAPVLATGGGLPVLFGPAFGFVASYGLTVPLVARFGRGTSPGSLAVWLVAAGLTLAVGTAYLACLLGSAPAAVAVGVAPFWLGDLGKTVLCFVAYTTARGRARAAGQG